MAIEVVSLGFEKEGDERELFAGSAVVDQFLCPRSDQPFIRGLGR